MQDIPIFDIYDYYYVPFWQNLWFQLLIGLFLVGIVGALIYKILAWRNKKQQEPWENAVEELQRLTIDPNQGQKFYASLTSIMKNYFAKTFGSDIQSKTDQEVVRLLHDEHTIPGLINDLEDIFLGPERIKFAKEEARAEQMAADQLKAFKIIQETKPNQGA